jgi:nucleotide-binding universal stress UspA family protein
MGSQRLKKVLVPVDGSDCSRAALQFACDLAARVGASVDALTVVERERQSKGEIARPANDAGMTAAQTELHQLIESVPHDGQKIVEHLDVGNPTERIVLAAERDDFDLIVMGTHGRTGRPRSLAGSVAESVVRNASCPVVTVRG